MIKGFDVNSVDAKRFTKPGEKFQNLRIDNNSTVTSINYVNDQQAQLEFRFTANYVGIGLIKIEGRILVECDAKSLVDSWSKTNNMPQEMANMVHGAVLSNCMPVAVVLARDIALPPPLPPIQPMQGMPKKPASALDSRRNSPEII